MNKNNKKLLICILIIAVIFIFVIIYLLIGKNNNNTANTKLNNNVITDYTKLPKESDSTLIYSIDVGGMLLDTDIINNFKNLEKTSNNLKLIYTCKNYSNGDTNSDINGNYDKACLSYDVNVNNLFDMTSLTTNAYGGTGTSGKLLKTKDYYIDIEFNGGVYWIDIYDLTGNMVFKVDNGIECVNPILYKNILYITTYDKNDKYYYEYIDLNNSKLTKTLVEEYTENNC